MNNAMPTVSKSIGSGPNLLRRLNEEALDKCREAMEAISRAHPNGRDFVYRSDEDYNQAAEKSRNAYATCQDLCAHFESILQHISDCEDAAQ